MDTHVHQIAAKHYGFRSGGSSKKVTMTPRLYDEINRKLADTWGEYAGWAHSVSDRPFLHTLELTEKQVFFTSDLKVFSTYGMQASSTSMESTPSSTRSATPSSNKRTRKTVPIDTDELPVIISQDVGNSVIEGTSLAERVKRRRRNVVY